MPEDIATTLANEVREGTLKLLWRQWRAIGASVTSPGTANAVVDLEALLLMSLWMLDQERRLADLAVSWVRINSSLVSIQRLRNLRPDFPAEVGGRLSALALVGMEEAKDARWKSLHDAVTAKLGQRGNKERAVEVRFNTWATLVLQLRRGMGVGTKADVLACVLGLNVVATQWASVSTLARAVAYTPAAVRRAADDLAESSFIRSLDTVQGERNSQRHYSVNTGAWAQLLRISPHQPGWIYWRDHFLFIVDLLSWLDALPRKRMSAYARDVGARDLLTRHRTTLLRDHVVDSTEFAGTELSMDYLTRVWRQFANWMENRG